MKQLGFLLSLFLLFLVSPVQGEDTTTLHGRFATNENGAPNVWIGVFESPMRPSAEAWSWTQVESTEFTLTVPDAEEIQLVALQKDSLPLVQQISSGSDEPFVLEFQDGISLDGTLLSTDGIPVADARLTVDRNDLPNVRIPDHIEYSWTSDADGRFKIGGLSPNERYEIQTELPFIQDERFPVRMPENGNYRQEFRLSDAYFVLGRVMDPDLSSLQHATVTSQFIPDELKTTTTSDAEGEFQLGPFARNKEMWLVATHDEEGSSPRLQATSGEHDIELTLGGMVQVIGTVIDASTGDLIDDFTLLAARADRSRTYPYIGSKGEISSRVDSRTTALIVDSDEHNAHFIVDLELESVDEYDLGVIALKPGRELTGQVLDASTGNPVEGATVSLYHHDWAGDIDLHWHGFIRSLLSYTVESITNEEGEYSLKPLPDESVRISARAWEYVSQELEVGEAATVLDIRLVHRKSLKTRIRGRIETGTGEPVGGMLSIQGDRGSTRSTVQDDGLFDHAVNPGTYKVRAMTDQGNSDTITVTVNEDETQEITLTVESKGRLSGNISGLWDGELVTLSVFSEVERSTVRNIYRIGNGEFHTAGIGFGEFTLNASSNRGREQVRTFELSAGSGEAFVELNFTGDSRLYGSVRFPDGSFPKGTVTAMPKQSGSTSSSSEINDDGTYEIRGLDDGEYTVRTMETEEIAVTNPDGSGFKTGTSTSVGQVDAVVRGDTELNIELTSP
ncbi:MAG: carboxypeptidase-like regulatory domain-containing protein [Gammaproteobacteria bacterium]|nr:carboxypeptidase-like regulatory domain-containing protein [Gammaproteobacteria bacterium]